jgi:hypothetical protein
MAAPRKRSGLPRRRRLDDEGDDNRSVATEQADDSQSDISVPSDIDEDADADNSDLSDADSTPSLTPGKPKRKVNGARDVKAPADAINRNAPSPPIARSDTKSTATRDMEMMMNGLNVSDKAADDEAIDFETGQAVMDAPPATTAPARPETLAERRRREHEEYKKKRDSDPAFIPNRGAFFMHDQRSMPGQNFRFSGRGRGRGRGGFGGPYPPAHFTAQAPEPIDAPWQHDLHQTVVDPPPQQAQAQPQVVPSTTAVPSGPAADRYNHAPAKPSGPPPAKPAPVRNFSTTVHTHNAVVRVFLPDMKAPVLFHNVPIRQHTRLPNHRPPLRRDKPVRISLPDQPPRYIFPTVERSFIFIPRALRPNQQGFGRGRGRGFGSFGGGFSSRRTSVYGGSVYSPSVAMSRRSSLAREMGRDGLVSPAGSILSRHGGLLDTSRPVVRLPPGGPKPPTAPSVVSPSASTPGGSIPPSQPYPLPQKPTYRENWQGQLTMHQPRPQKAVSVAGIESPASMNFHPPPQQEQQPFHQQMPTHVNGNAPPDQATYYPHTRQLSYPSQASTGTPLSNIPERAIHAPAFQPNFQQPGFQPQGFPMQQNYYYPVPNGTQPQYAAPAGMVPMFNVQQASYVMPMTTPGQAPAPTSAPGQQQQSTMVAYEQNGMTYYVDPTQLYAPPPMEGYTPPSYAVPGMGGMMTPSPEGYGYYPAAPPVANVYYPAQQ